MACSDKTSLWRKAQKLRTAAAAANKTMEMLPRDEVLAATKTSATAMTADSTPPNANADLSPQKLTAATMITMAPK